MSNRFTAFVEQNHETMLAAYGGAAIALAFVAGLLANMGAI
jgi:hypothetical protein